MIAERKGEDDTAEATKVDHVYVWVNELAELMAWIGSKGLGVERQGSGLW